MAFPGVPSGCQKMARIFQMPFVRQGPCHPFCIGRAASAAVLPIARDVQDMLRRAVETDMSGSAAIGAREQEDGRRYGGTSR